MVERIFIVSDEDPFVVQRKLNYYLETFSGKLCGSPFAVGEKISCAVVADESLMPDLGQFADEIEELSHSIKTINDAWDDHFGYSYYDSHEDPLDAAMSVINELRYDRYRDALDEINNLNKDLNRLRPLLYKLSSGDYQGDEDPVWDEIQD